MTNQQDQIHIRKPLASDGLQIHQLIANSPPLDLNSIYSYYLLADHFRDSCVVCECNGKVAGFLSAYLIPQRPDTLFVWQVVVDGAQRGKKIAWRMLNELLSRFDKKGLRYVEATVNPGNVASRRLFERLAVVHGNSLEWSEFLDATAFGPAEQHESEILLRVALSNQDS